MSLLGRVAVRQAKKAALICVVSLLILQERSMCVAAQATGPQGCPAKCSCYNQLSKVVCTRRSLTRVPLGIPINTRHLNLMENSIEQIEADSFRHLRHLEVLQLGRNTIRQIEVGAFNGLTNLNTLELFDNRLTVVPSGAFEYLSKLRELWLRNNPIESIPSYAFNRVPSLMRLDLGELRKLEYISEGAFEGLYNLKYLNLGMCNIQGDMPNLSPLQGLEELEISENLFPEIKPGSFRSLRSLKKLWIMNSQIGLIERNAFDELTSLVELNLAHNNLSTLPHDLFTPLRYLVELHLHHNPWNCGCDSIWLSKWLREYIPTNSTCCGRCHSPAHMRGFQLVELGQGDNDALQCSAPFIADAPRDLNISADRVAELRCQTAAMSAVRWLMPNGTILTHASKHLRIIVLNDGTLNFSNVLVGDTGMYTCMVSNAAGKSNASAYLNVSAAELNTSNLSYFSTVTIEVLGATSEMPKSKTPTSSSSTTTTATVGTRPGTTTTTTTSSSIYQPVFISTPTVFLQNTDPPPSRPVSVPNSKVTTGRAPGPSLDEVMKTTKIIIGCFVAVTLLAAIMLIAFYKLRKRHQKRGSVAADKTVEIVHVEREQFQPPTSSGMRGRGSQTLPEIKDHSSIHKLDCHSYRQINNSYNTPSDFPTYKPSKVDCTLHRQRSEYAIHRSKPDYYTYKPTLGYNIPKPTVQYKSLPDFRIQKQKSGNSPLQFHANNQDYHKKTQQTDYSPFKDNYNAQNPRMEYIHQKSKTGHNLHATTNDYNAFKKDTPFKSNYTAFKAEYRPLEVDYVMHKPENSLPKPKLSYSPHKVDFSHHKIDYTLRPKYNTYKPVGHGAKWTENHIANSLPRTLPSTLSKVPEAFLIKARVKEKVQETQI